MTYTMKIAKTKPFLMRLKPSTKHLLEKAKEDQRRSISSLIDESVRNQLGYRYDPDAFSSEQVNTALEKLPWPTVSESALRKIIRSQRKRKN